MTYAGEIPKVMPGADVDAQLQPYGLSRRALALWVWRGKTPTTDAGILVDQDGSVYIHKGTAVVATVHRDWWRAMGSAGSSIGTLLTLGEPPKTLNLPDVPAVIIPTDGPTRGRECTPRGRVGLPESGEHLVCYVDGAGTMRTPMAQLNEVERLRARLTGSISLRCLVGAPVTP